MAADALAPNVISSHDIDSDYVEYAGPDLTWGRILRTCVISMWSNDIKCKYMYMFMFSLKNLARKGLSVLKCPFLNTYPSRMTGSTSSVMW